ncbi:HdeD family acid-resistance protein [Pseudanabaenaceae cyanobacterium LEGE 13415]|nr:HdeD family acid-resistance protein [Pseudanabaenaceae cyanobacterium LEGE 13415]
MRVRESETTQQTKPSGGWGIAAGIILVILGLIAFARPFYATIATTLAFGWLFIIAGIGQFIYAFGSRSAGQVIWKIALGILYLLAGIFLVGSPIAGALSVTLVLGITIFLQGVIQVFMAFQIRPARAWGGVLVSGLLGIILGIFIWSNFPFNAAWILGLFVGVSLLVNGIWIISLSSASR